MFSELPVEKAIRADEKLNNSIACSEFPADMASPFVL